MISRRTIDDLRDKQREYLARALEMVDEAGIIKGDVHMYSHLVSEARKYKECADDLERFSVV